MAQEQGSEQSQGEDLEGASAGNVLLADEPEDGRRKAHEEHESRAAQYKGPGCDLGVSKVDGDHVVGPKTLSDRRRIGAPQGVPDENEKVDEAVRQAVVGCFFGADHGVEHHDVGLFQTALHGGSGQGLRRPMSLAG